MSGVLLDPVLELHDGQGSLIFQNDNWRSDQEQQIIDSTVPPLNDKEAAIVATLPPGAYTAIVHGTGSTTGVALVEVYSLDPSPRHRLRRNDYGIWYTSTSATPVVLFLPRMTAV